MELIESITKRGDCFWDVGAHQGYVTLLAGRCVGPEGMVYAFEPSPYSRGFLRKHVAWNACSNVEILPVALAARVGRVRLVERGSSQTFHLAARGRTVEAASLSALLDQGLRPPDVLKLDVEGAEGDILEADAHRLPRHCRLLVSVHSHSNFERSMRALRGQGFAVLASQEVDFLRQNETGEWSTDAELFAVGPAGGGIPSTVASLPLFRG